MTSAAESADQSAWSALMGVTKATWVDIAAMLWRERWLVLAVAGAVCALGLAAALAAPRTYTARAELLVRLGEEYVYQPMSGNAAAGATPDMQAVVNAEMRMIGSGAVVRHAIETVGLERLYPDIAASGGSQARKIAAAERAFARALSVETAPQTPAIGLSYQHKNAEIAAAALNALIESYFQHRREVLVGGEYEALANQTQDLGQRAARANAALAAFLTENGIGDFESEMAALAARAGDIETQLLDAQTRRGEAEARAAALRTRLSQEPEQIELYSESDARRELVQAQVEREQLLSRYQDDAMPVREVDRRIAQLQAFLAGGDPPTITRRGVNPVRQEIAGQLYGMEAEARAQRGREAALIQQRQDVHARLRSMQQLEPTFRQLQREKTILESSTQSFATRAEEARVRSRMLGESSDTISTVQRADVPTQGKSLRWPIMIVTLLIAAIVSCAAGLSRGLLRRNYPTPSSAARALGAPVLAVMPRVRTAGAKRAGRSASRAKPSLTLVKGDA